MTFEKFITDNLERGITEFRLVARMEDRYTPRFYIHAIGYNSDTPNFLIDENVLFPIPKEEES